MNIHRKLDNLKTQKVKTPNRKFNQIFWLLTLGTLFPIIQKMYNTTNKTNSKEIYKEILNKSQEPERQAIKNFNILFLICRTFNI